MDINLQAIHEQKQVAETLATPGARIIAAKLRIVARETYRKEMKADPFKDPGEIVKARQLRYVLKTLLPQIVEGIVNYDPDAPDKQAAPADRWNIVAWLRQVFNRKG